MINSRVFVDDTEPTGTVRSVKWSAMLQNLGKQLDDAATLACVSKVSYAKGFSDGTLLREFCDDYSPEPYFPTADSRPRAERLGWCQPS